MSYFSRFRFTILNITLIFNYNEQFCHIDSIRKYLRFKMRYFYRICIHYQGQWATVTWGLTQMWIWKFCFTYILNGFIAGDKKCNMHDLKMLKNFSCFPLYKNNIEHFENNWKDMWFIYLNINRKMISTTEMLCR